MKHWYHDDVTPYEELTQEEKEMVELKRQAIHDDPFSASQTGLYQFPNGKVVEISLFSPSQS